MRRSRRLAPATAAAPSPDSPPLLDLPTDLLVRVVSRCDPTDIARVAAVSLLFYAPLATEAIRLWVQERGFELPTQPEGEGCAVRWLCYSALLCESNPPATAAAGSRHSLFIDGEGRLSSCGEAKTIWLTGLLGHGEGVTRLNTPTHLPSALGERAMSVTAGAVHSIALTTDGSVWSWGYGGAGRLGHGDEQSQLLPKKVEVLAGQRVVAVAAGAYHSLAITADGSVWSWGGGGFGRLGHGDEQSQHLDLLRQQLRRCSSGFRPVLDSSRASSSALSWLIVISSRSTAPELSTAAASNHERWRAGVRRAPAADRVGDLPELVDLVVSACVAAGVLVVELLVPVLNQLRPAQPREVLGPAAPAAPLDQQPPAARCSLPGHGRGSARGSRRRCCRVRALPPRRPEHLHRRRLPALLQPLPAAPPPAAGAALASAASRAFSFSMAACLDRRPFFERRRRPFARALQSVGHARVHKVGLDLEHDILVRVGDLGASEFA